jgi:hypothetical protein
MTTMKSLAVVALLFGGTSLALAQTPPTTGPQAPANIGAAPAGGAGYTGNQAAPSRHAAKHNKKIFLSAKGTHHKGSKLTPAGNAKPKLQQ